jgi:glycosyltransferase involved in cell wall biosynthesis
MTDPNKEPLVSIITPCFNGASFVRRFLDSVLDQTYSNIEFIFVNDGSTDDTERIVFSYQEKFSSKGIRFIYIFQENKGLAGALNQGLEIFTGEYLTWPDSDDVLHPDNISKKVSFLEKNKDCGMVLCKVRVFNEKNMKQIRSLQRIPPIDGPDDLFHDLIEEKNACLACGGYMVRTSAFLLANPEKTIYASRGGQNWQMLLPIAYRFTCGYIDEFLYDYMIREESHSHSAKSLEDHLKRAEEHEDILKTVISSMDMDEKERNNCIAIIDRKYARKRFWLAANFRDHQRMQMYYDILREHYPVTGRDRYHYLKGSCALFFYADMMLRTLLRSLLKIKKALG